MKTLAVILLQFLALNLIFVIILAIRIKLIEKHLIHALNITNLYVQRALHLGLPDEPYWNIYFKYGEFPLLLFDLTKWTFRQFYPDLIGQFKRVVSNEHLKGVDYASNI